jgi:aryl-alcohol dehydrogenase-like predicted oxidoreductase
MSELLTDSNKPISCLGLGCARIGSFSNGASRTETRRLLDRALDLGVNVFDTADAYGQGDSERMLGTFLRGQRDRAFVISKVGLAFSRQMRLLRPLKPLVKSLLGARAGAEIITRRRNAGLRNDFTPGYLTLAVEASLRRLRFDALDALLLHSPSAADLADADLGAALQRVKDSGKARHVGVSCDDIESLRAALRWPWVTVLEIPQAVLRTPGARDLLATPGHRHVFAREVIRMQPDLSPLIAVASSLRDSAVDCVLVGTTRPAHVDELARAFIRPVH